MTNKATTAVKSTFFKLFLLIIAISVFQSCEENPNDVGVTFLRPEDTTGVLYLDSQIDSMPITNNNYKLFINTSISPYLLVGNYQNYTSRSLLKFTNISADLDSSNVLSAVLTLKYGNYYFKDSLGNTSFNMYKLISDYNYSTVTYDSVTSSGIGMTSVGSFSGVVSDSQTVDIALSNQEVESWFEYAADTTYPQKNFGMILFPDLSSTTIKGFYSANNSSELVPYVTVIYVKNQKEDTVTLNISESVNLSDAPSSIIPSSETFVLQNGISYANILSFDLTKLPGNVIVNNATLQLTLDNASSFISPSTDKRLIIGMVTDSVTKTDSIFTQIFLSDSNTYLLSSTAFNSIVQRWNSSILPNLGITINNYFELLNLDNFYIYSPSATDVSKRPRLKITYTPRD